MVTIENKCCQDTIIINNSSVSWYCVYASARVQQQQRTYVRESQRKLYMKSPTAIANLMKNE